MCCLWVNPSLCLDWRFSRVYCVWVFTSLHTWVCVCYEWESNRRSGELRHALPWQSKCKNAKHHSLNQAHVPKDELDQFIRPLKTCEHQTEDILMLFDLLFVPEALLSIWRVNVKADMSQWLLWQAVVDTITRPSTIKEPILLFFCILFNHWHKLFHMHRTSQNSSMDVCWSQRSLWQRFAVKTTDSTPDRRFKSCFDCLCWDRETEREESISALYSATV